METARHRADCIRKDCEKQERVSEERAAHFEYEKQRLKSKFEEAINGLLKIAANTIAAELKTTDFNSRFQAAVLNIPYKRDLEEEYLSNEASGRGRFTRDRDLYKLYLHEEFENCIRRELKPALDQSAEEGIKTLSQIFCDDVGLASEERDTFHHRLKAKHLQKTCECLQKVLNNMLQSLHRALPSFTDAFLNQTFAGAPAIAASLFDAIFDRNARALAKESRWQDFRSTLAQKCCAILEKMVDPAAIERCHRDLTYPSLFLNQTMDIMAKLYVETSQWHPDKTARMNEVAHLMDSCDVYLEDTLVPLSSAFNAVQGANLDLWSLSADMVTPGGRIRGTSSDEMGAVYRAELKQTPSSDAVDVYVRQLSGDFCALHVCNQTRASPAFNHPNILHCYGAFYENNHVYVVTERWKKTVKSASSEADSCCLEQRLRIAVELTELCLQMTPRIPIEQLKPSALYIGRDNCVKVNCQTYKPSLLGRIAAPHKDLHQPKQINQALGLIFHRLFMPIDGLRSISQSLRSLVNHLRTQADVSDPCDIIPMTHILHRLKTDEVSGKLLNC